MAPLATPLRRASLVTISAALAALGLAATHGTAATATPAPHTAGTAPARDVAPDAVPHRVLFDNSKAETAGNADWIVSTSIPTPTNQNPAPLRETDWTGALSAWGVALQRTGQYVLSTLPAGTTITFGGTGALDLSRFDAFVLPEPNIRLSSAEKTAVLRFVQNGGGLFLISDHNGSDRNNDGFDSPHVINDLLTSNGVDNTDPFGFSVDLLDVANENPRAISAATDPVLHGPFGTVTGSIMRDGTTVTLHPADNAAVRGLVYRASATPGGSTGAFFATSTFGSGRVAVWGDSSPIDDGTGQPGNTLFDGWDDPAGTDAALALNATAWLAGGGTGGGGGSGCASPGQLLGNPGFESGTAPWSATASVIATNGARETARTGTHFGWLDGYGTTHTDTLSQQVGIPAGCTASTLTFWLHVDTDETSTTTRFDTLTLTAAGSTLASFSNLDAAAGYQQRSVAVGQFAGQSVTLTFTGTEGTQLQTSFAIDDTALTAA